MRQRFGVELIMGKVYSECSQGQRLRVVVAHIGYLDAALLDGTNLVSMVYDLAGSGHEDVLSSNEEGLQGLVIGQSVAEVL